MNLREVIAKEPHNCQKCKELRERKNLKLNVLIWFEGCGERNLAEIWEILLPIVGAGIVGYVIRWFEEKRRRTHEREVEYRKELKKHYADVFEPFFKLLGDLWDGLIDLVNPDFVDYEGDDAVLAKGQKLKEPIKEVRKALTNLTDFITENETKFDLLLPLPLQSFQYSLLEEHVIKVIKDAERGRFTFSDISKPVYAIMGIQEDLQNILGFKIKMHLKSEFAFKERLSRFEKFKLKVKYSPTS